MSPAVYLEASILLEKTLETLDNMKQYLKGNNDKFFVVGVGFVADTAQTASALTDEQLDNLEDAGMDGEVIEINASYAVNYIRKDDIKIDAQGKVTIEMNKKNPSKRRFATFDEASCHGSHFATRKAKAGDEPGTAGHVGYWVSESTDEVNAEINWKTRLTNPLGFAAAE